MLNDRASACRSSKVKRCYGDVVGTLFHASRTMSADIVRQEQSQYESRFVAAPTQHLIEFGLGESLCMLPRIEAHMLCSLIIP